ncbi:MAG: hypothetical protein LBI26_00460 [Holosporales bacterium]|jgi:adenylate cyclase|nr:hypothetical protein [Holosporales bacterium]
MKFLKNRKIKFDILTAFSALIGLTVASEILYSSYANKKLVLNFEKEYYSKVVSQTTTNWLDEYFNHLEMTIDIFAKSFNPKNDINNFDKYSVLFLESLKSIPYTAGFYISFKDGTHFEATTLNEITNYQSGHQEKLPNYAKFALRTIRNDPKAKMLKEEWTYLNEDFGTISKEELQKVQFNPTKRDWYIKAELQKNKVWNDVYLSKTTKVAGITLSMPLGYYSDGTAIGIIGIDFTTKQFKDLLKKIKPSENSKNYLINDKNELIASSTDIKTFTLDEKTDELSLLSVSNSGDGALEGAIRNTIGEEKIHATYKADGEMFLANIQKLEGMPFYFLSISPQDDFTAGFSTIQRDMLIISIFIFLTSIGIIFLLSRRISIPITSLCRAAESIGAMDLDNYLPPCNSNILEIQKLVNAINSMKLSVSTFSKYAPKDLVNKLVSYGITPTLGGQTKNITIMFTDIENFSVISENLPAEYLMLHLSEYFDTITQEIMNNSGIIDKYIGDSIMALWGAPNNDDDQCINACYAALRCQELINELRIKWAPLGKPAFPTRIGIHSGSVIVGNIGSHNRMNFTAIGDAVDIASRLEGINKLYGTNILVSENVESAARGKVLFRIIDKIAVKGKNIGTVIFEPLCAMKDADDQKYYKQIELCAKSKEAFEFYQKRDFNEALSRYKALIRIFPEIERSLTGLIIRCEKYMQTPPNSDWDGTLHLEKK